jgi:hypothetical protein
LYSLGNHQRNKDQLERYSDIWWNSGEVMPILGRPLMMNCLWIQSVEVGVFPMRFDERAITKKME